MSKNSDSPKRTTEIRNRKASHDYFVGETFEAGLVLQGTEVKSLREGKAQIQDAFVRIEKNEAFLYNAHINEYDFGNLNNHKPTRTRKLLLHTKEILKLKSECERNAMALIPLKIYFSKGRAKILIALAKGKKLYDKRDDVKKREALKEAKSAMKYKA